jgi:hypothetical protein
MTTVKKGVNIDASFSQPFLSEMRDMPGLNDKLCAMQNQWVENFLLEVKEACWSRDHLGVSEDQDVQFHQQTYQKSQVS